MSVTSFGFSVCCVMSTELLWFSHIFPNIEDKMYKYTIEEYTLVYVARGTIPVWQTDFHATNECSTNLKLKTSLGWANLMYSFLFFFLFMLRLQALYVYDFCCWHFEKIYVEFVNWVGEVFFSSDCTFTMVCAYNKTIVFSHFTNDSQLAWHQTATHKHTCYTFQNAHFNHSGKRHDDTKLYFHIQS